MELNIKSIFVILLLVVLALVVTGATSKVYVNYNMQRNSILNASNISIDGNFSDGVLSILDGLVKDAIEINSTRFYQNGRLVIDTLSLANDSILRNESLTWIAGRLDNASIIRTQHLENSTIVRTYQLENGTIVRSGDLKTALSNYTGAVISYLQVNDTINATLNWTSLQGFPVACPANTFITQLGDAVVCASSGDFYLNDTGDTVTGNYVITGNVNATELGGELSWTNLRNYPGACAANNFLSAVGDALTCSIPLDTRSTADGFYLYNDSTTMYFNESKINVTIAAIREFDYQVNFSANITQSTGFGHCFGDGCPGSIYYNGTSLVIKVN